MNNEKTGNLISQIRKEKGLTQMQLAQKLGVSNATISKWETAKGFPDISLIEPLAETLDISVSEILTGERFEKNDETEELLNDLVDLSINEQKRKEKIHNWIIAITVAILYLIVSLITKRWEVTWIIWFVYCFYRVATEYILKKHRLNIISEETLPRQ